MQPLAPVVEDQAKLIDELRQPIARARAQQEELLRVQQDVAKQQRAEQELARATEAEAKRAAAAAAAAAGGSAPTGKGAPPAAAPPKTPWLVRAYMWLLAILLLVESVYVLLLVR